MTRHHSSLILLILIFILAVGCQPKGDAEATADSTAVVVDSVVAVEVPSNANGTSGNNYVFDLPVKGMLNDKETAKHLLFALPFAAKTSYEMLTLFDQPENRDDPQTLTELYHIMDPLVAQVIDSVEVPLMEGCWSSMWYKIQFTDSKVGQVKGWLQEVDGVYLMGSLDNDEAFKINGMPDSVKYGVMAPHSMNISPQGTYDGDAECETSQTVFFYDDERMYFIEGHFPEGDWEKHYDAALGILCVNMDQTAYAPIGWEGTMTLGIPGNDVLIVQDLYVSYKGDHLFVATEPPQ